FFSSRRRHTRFSRDWSSDVCSSDLTDVSCDRPNAVNVVFTAGYPGSIPRVAWLAIMAAVKALYNGCEPGDAYWAMIDRLRWGPRSEERRVGRGGRAGGSAGRWTVS